jgi:hypothetical protein
MMHAMTYDEFQRQVYKAGLTLIEFAELTKMNRISLSNRRKKGDVPSHWAVTAVLVAEMAEHKIDFRKILSRIEMEPKKPRGAGKRGKFGGDKQRDLELFVQDGAPRSEHEKY